MIPHRHIAMLYVALAFYACGATGCGPTAREAELVDAEAAALERCREESANAEEELRCGEAAIEHFDLMNEEETGSTNR